jgi:hypothetical protein
MQRKHHKATRYRPRAVLMALVGVCAVSLTAGAAKAASSNCELKLLQGTWQLQSAIYRDQTGKVVGEIKDQQTKSRKLIAGRHFSFITWQADGKFVVAASGTFTADASGYHEQVDTTSLARLQDKTYHFQCQLSGDKWLHQGLEDGITIEEHWLRVSGVTP